MFCTVQVRTRTWGRKKTALKKWVERPGCCTQGRVMLILYLYLQQAANPGLAYGARGGGEGGDKDSVTCVSIYWALHEYALHATAQRHLRNVVPIRSQPIPSNPNQFQPIPTNPNQSQRSFYTTTLILDWWIHPPPVPAFLQC